MQIYSRVRFFKVLLNQGMISSNLKGIFKSFNAGQTHLKYKNPITTMVSAPDQNPDRYLGLAEKIEKVDTVRIID